MTERGRGPAAPPVPRLDAALGPNDVPTPDRFRWMVESVNDVIFEADPMGCWTYLNPAWTRILGHPVQESLGHAFLEYVHPEDRQPNLDIFMETLGSGKSVCRFEARYLTADGETRYMEISAWIFRDGDGTPLGSTGTLTDVTDRRLAELELEHRATHDPLTGLPNRALLCERIERLLADGTDKPLTLLFFDLDRFKLVNDSLGHDVGDAVLRLVSDRLRLVAVPGETVARFGGDEFVLLCDGNDELQAEDRAARLRALLAPPFEVEGNTLRITASIGIRVVRRHGTETSVSQESAVQMLRDADAAMYEAKAGGRDRAATFEPGTRARVVARLAGESELRRAIDGGELVLHHQPQLSLEDHRLLGFEALIRWNHPDRGLVFPDEFIPLAEECGLIDAIGRWVLMEACKDLDTAESQGVALPRISVNVSAQQLTAGLIDDVRAALSETGASPCQLCLELTESALLADTDAVKDTLEGLAALGVSLSLDDFGTGFSSLAYLQRLPLRELKIDRSFVRRIDKPDGAAIVLAILRMADALKLETIGEGVERAVEARLLSSYGCGGVQGYRYARPGPLLTVLAATPADLPQDPPRAQRPVAAGAIS